MDRSECPNRIGRAGDDIANIGHACDRFRSLDSRVGHLSNLARGISTSNPDPESIIGIWKGVATTGSQSAEGAFDIQRLEKGVGLYMTLPRLRAWRMPVGYLRATSDGAWAILDWHVTLRRDGESLVGELGDPRVPFQMSRAATLPAEIPPPDLPSGPQPDWTYDTGAPLWAGLVAEGNAIYAADVKGRLHAVRAADGVGIWTSDLGAPVYGAPLATDDALFVFDDAGLLKKLRRSSGKELWRTDLGASGIARVLPAANVFTFDFHAPTPVLHSGVVYISSSHGQVHAIDANDGRVRWRRPLNSRVRATAAVTSKHVFVGTLNNDLVALDRRSGDERWRFTSTGPITSAAVVVDDLVLVGSRGSWITALKANTGSPVWARFDWFSWIESTGTVVDGVYYVGSSDLRSVRALDARTGTPLWETDVFGWAWGTPVVTRDTVYIGVAGPQKYVTKHEAGLVAIDRRTGTVKWRNRVERDRSAFVSGYPGSVIVAARLLVAPNVNGTLEGYRLP